VSSKPIVEEMGCYRINGKTLRASDGALLVQVELVEDTELNCTVPAAGLKTLLKDLKCDDVSLKLDGGKLTVVADKVRGRFTLASGPGVLDDLKFGAAAWRPATPAFKTAVRMCRFAASRDASKGVYCGVILKGDSALATDKIRIAMFKTKEDLSSEPIILPAEAAALLDKRAVDIDQWAAEGGTVYFRGKGVTWGSRMSAGEYTSKVWAYVEKSAELLDKVDLPKTMTEMLQRHLDQQSSAMDMDRAVTVAISGKELKIASTDGVRYEMEETAEIAEAASGGLKFEIHPQCLIDILSTTGVMKYDSLSTTTADGKVQLRTPFVAFQATLPEGDYSYLTTIEGK
jgi:DNA polymerase III sliding clamp (beta) subunit (PCNA family)